MIILKRTNGLGEEYDTENMSYSAISSAKPDTRNSLHLFHQQTDLQFLKGFFPESHPIFIQFSVSFYFVITWLNRPFLKKMLKCKKIYQNAWQVQIFILPLSYQKNNDMIKIPTFDQKITLISHGETITFSRDNSAIETYSWKTSRGYGIGQTEISKSEVEKQIQTLLQKGFEYA